MAEKIFFIIIVVLFAIHIFEFVGDLLFDLYTERQMQSHEFKSLGGPIRNIRYFDKDGNEIFYPDLKAKERALKRKKREAFVYVKEDNDEIIDLDDLN